MGLALRLLQIYSATVNWNAEDPLFQELFRFSWFLQGSRNAAMVALEKAFKRLSGRPEAAERDRAARFLFMQLRRCAPKPGRICDFESAGDLRKLHELSEPERSLAGLFYTTRLPAADVCRILGHPQQDLARRLCLLRRKISPSGTPADSPPPVKPGARELQEAFARFDAGDANSSGNPENSSASCGEKFSRDVDSFWLGEFSKISPNLEESAVLTDWANHLETRAKSWRPSPRDPAMIGLACALVFLVGIVVWSVVGSAEAFHGKARVLAILDEGVEAGAAEYEPVSGNLGELGDWLALQGLDGIAPPPGFASQRMVAARIFPFEGTKVATVLMPDSEMAAFFFDADSVDIEVKPLGNWKFFTRGQDSAAIIQRGRNAFMVAIRGSPEDLQRRLEAISSL